MDIKNIELLFALLRSAFSSYDLTEEEKSLYEDALLPEIFRIAKKHDVAHLLAYALQKNGLLPEGHAGAERQIAQAFFRCEGLLFEQERIYHALEEAKIPYLPLKGAILRGYYPESWMRTSCDVDVLVRRADVERGVACLTQVLGYEEQERATHDISMRTPQGHHVELHFDLVEEGRARNAIGVLSSVWQHVTLCENSAYRYEMTDAFFYFYHIAHMAKHFESGGCGIRPFIDLKILSSLDTACQADRKELLEKGGLSEFAWAAERLTSVWFDGEDADEIPLQMQEFILTGGVYGTAANRVVLQQKKKGGRFRYFLSRVFVPYDKLKRYYPILEKHPYLLPFMQVRRWLMLLRPDVRGMAKRELQTNYSIDKEKAEEMNTFLQKIGLS